MLFQPRAVFLYRRWRVQLGSHLRNTQVVYHRKAVDVTGEMDPATIIAFRVFLNKYFAYEEREGNSSTSETNMGIHSFDIVQYNNFVDADGELEAKLVDSSLTKILSQSPNSEESKEIDVQQPTGAVLEGEQQRRANASWLALLREQVICREYFHITSEKIRVLEFHTRQSQS